LVQRKKARRRRAFLSLAETVMNVLVIDSSSSDLHVALQAGERQIAKSAPCSQQHATYLLPWTQTLLDELGLVFADLDLIAVTAGPGAFTGLRIGAGVALGLAAALDIPLLGLSTLEVLAEACEAPYVLAALDARMGEVYLSAYQRGDAGLENLIAPCLLPLNAQLPDLPAADWVMVGSGAALLQAQPPYPVRSEVGITPAALCKVALRQAHHARPAREFELDYVRNKVAQTTAERASA
jgi:tRNA threonylcarbamoyladenosine biosynthesis protein TsaB